MRVMLVSHSAQPGGSNVVVRSLLRHSPPDVEAGCVFLEDGPVLTELIRSGFEARLVHAGRARELWRIPGTVRELAVAARRSRADIIFAHVTKAHLYASPAAALTGIPYVWWQHERRSQKPAMHLVSGRLPAQAVICSSRWTAAEQRAPFRGTVHVIPPGAEFEPAPAAHHHAAGAGDPVLIGTAGRLQRWKRVELALHAMTEVLAREPAARLRIIGGTTRGIDEDYEPELRRLAKQLGIDGAVEFRGQVPNVEQELAQLDVLLHTAEHEPFGLVIVEALAHGVPVVAVDEGGPREIVRPGTDGLLAAPTAARLGDAVLELAADPARRAVMGSAGRDRALREFSAGRMASETWALLTSLASRSPT